MDWLLLHAQLLATRISDETSLGSTSDSAEPSSTTPDSNLNNISSSNVRLPLEQFFAQRSLLFDPERPNKYSRLIISEYSDLVSTLPLEDFALPHLPENLQVYAYS